MKRLKKLKLVFHLKTTKEKTSGGRRAWHKYERETITLNEYFNLHFRAMQVVRDYWREWVRILMKDREGRFKNKVRFSLYCRLKNPIDADNAIIYIKFLNDALCHIGTIEDDTWQHVEIGRIRVKKSPENTVTVILKALEDPIPKKKNKADKKRATMKNKKGR